MTDLPALRRTALDWITANEGRMSAFNERIWHYAEPAWREYKSAAAYVELLRAEGFEVEAGSGGMPTAFCARWGNAVAPLQQAWPGSCRARQRAWSGARPVADCSERTLCSLPCLLLPHPTPPSPAPCR